jgi:hypothetical protein
LHNKGWCLFVVCVACIVRFNCTRVYTRVCHSFFVGVKPLDLWSFQIRRHILPFDSVRSRLRKGTSPDKNEAALSSDPTQEEWHILADSVEAKREEEE